MKNFKNLEKSPKNTTIAHLVPIRVLRFWWVCVTAIGWPTAVSFGQKTLFSTEFDFSPGASYTTTVGNIGATTWEFNRSAGNDFGARIHNGMLELTNNATASPNASGWAFVYQDASAHFNSPYNPTLSLNTGQIEWYFNLRQSNPDPSGFGTGFPYGNGCAFVLACTSPNAGNTGTGYAVAFGESGTLDRLKLFRFTNGLQGPKTDIFTLIFNGTPDFGNEYFSFKLTYNPHSNWFSARAFLDGVSGFLDPTRSNGQSYGGNKGPALAETSLSMPYSGVYYQAGGSPNGSTFFDNFTVIQKPSDPGVGSLTYNQNFGTNAFSATPASFRVWGGVPGNATSNLAQAEANLPYLDVDVVSQFGGFSSEPAGGAYGVGGGVDARLGIATSSDAEKGLCQPVLGVQVDSGITRLKVVYDQIILFSGQRTCGNALQYRKIGTQTWTTLPESILNIGSYPTLNLRNKKSLLLTVPNEKASYQFRWISWRVNGSGSSNTSLGLDNVVVSAPVSDRFLISSGTSPSAGVKPAGTNNVVLQQISLHCPAYSAAALINSLSIDTKGTYQASDLSNLKVYYSTDNVWDAGDLLLVTKTSGIGPGFHYLLFGSSPTLNPNTTGYLFLTADLAAGAQAGKTIYSDVVYQLSVGSNAEILGTFPLAEGGVQTISRPPTLATPPTFSGLGFGSVTLNGKVLSTNFANITEQGFYYSTTNGFPDGSGTKVSTTGSFGTGSFSEVVSSLPASTTYYFKSFATNAAGTVYSAQGSFSTPKNAPQNAATGFTCGTTAAFSIPLSWTDASGSPLPDGYLIRWSPVSYAAIPNPTDGVPVANGATNLNVAYGIQSATATGLAHSTTYYFKIFSYTNSGTNIRYRTAPVGQTTCATLSGSIENFEAGTKTVIFNEDVNCTLGSWNFSGSLLGTSVNDLKAGLQSARIQTGGSVSMNFDVFGGSSSISVKNGRFVGQPASSFNIDYSTNQGSSWTNVGNLSNSTGLTTNNFTISVTRPTRFRMVHSGGSGTFNADDFTIVPFCAAPEPTSSVIVSNMGATGCDIAWGSAAGNGTMLVLRPTASTNTLPNLNASFTANTNWASAGQIDVNNRVVFRASGGSVSGVTGLSAETQYTATAYNYNNTLNCYQLENPASASFWTHSLEPGAHAGSFSASAFNNSQINLSFSAANTLANADGYLILMKAGSVPGGNPADGIAYSAGDILGDATVAARVNSPSATTASITGLNPETLYYFVLVPFNWNGSQALTYNYRTAATIPQASATTTAPPSAQSDILVDPNFAYSSNIPIINFQDPNANAVANTVAVLKIIVRDGGGAEDADAFPTILNKLRISYSPSSAIRSAGLFGGSGQSTYLTHLSTVPSTFFEFTNLNTLGSLVTAGDGGSVELTLRITFSAAITDKSQLAFSLEGASCEAFPTNSSQIYAFPEEVSSIYQDRNRLEILATTLDFLTQPATREVNVALRAFVIQAEDALGNVDTDQNTCQVALTKGTGLGVMSAPGSPYTFTNGQITVTDVSFNAASTFTIVATAQSCLGNNAKTSSSFAVTAPAFVTGDYRSNPLSGTVWTTLSHWQVRSGGTWIAATAFPGSASRVYIGTNMTVAASTSVAEIIIPSGGTLNISTEIGASTLVWVKTGGTLNLTANLATQAATDLIVENGANLIINYACTNQSTLWTGDENFEETSTVTIRNWGVSASPTSSRVLYNGSNISQNGRNLFGNLFVDLSTNLGNTLFLYDDNANNYITAGTLTIKSTNAAQRVSLCSSSGGDLVQLRGNLVVDALYAATGNFQMGASGSNRIKIGGDLILNGGTTLLKSATTSVSDTLDVSGNLSVGANVNLLFNESGSGNTFVFLRIKGDVTVNTTGNIRNGSANNGVGNYRMIFNGSGDGSSPAKTQVLSIASSSTSLENVNVRFECAPGSYVKLTHQDLQLGQNSTLYVDNNATLDFGFSGALVPLLVSESGTANGTSFLAADKATLKITSAAGVANSGTTGNVQTDTRTFGNAITFWYAGKANQATGNALSATTGYNLICDLDAANLSLSPNAHLSFPLRSFVEIRQGKLIENTSGSISGEGHLVMTGGTFASTIPNGVHPNLSDFDRFSIGSGTFELGASGNQTLNFLPSAFASLVISGSGTKTLSESISLSSNLSISGGTFSPGAYEVSGGAGLTMTGGTFVLTKTGSTPLPELTGAYSLTGGTIELNGSDGETSQILRTSTGSLAPISYFDLDLRSVASNGVTHNVETAGNLIVQGTCRVKSPTVFFLDASKKVSGSGSFILDSAATLKITDPFGLTPNACGTGASCGQVVTNSRTFSAGAGYWFSGNSAGAVTGTGLPAQVQNLIISRSGGSDISLSQNTLVRKGLTVSDNGMLLTGSFKIVLSDSALISEQDLAHIRGLVETTRTLSLAAHDFGGLGLVIDADGNSPGPTLVQRFVGITVGNGINEAIREKFVITPTTNTGLNASLLFRYFESEINALDETNFTLYRSVDGGLTWLEQSGCVLYPEEDYVQKSGIPAFSDWTLGDVNVPLPQTGLRLKGRTEPGIAYLEWTTETGRGIRQFLLQKSRDGQTFADLVRVDPAEFPGNAWTYRDADFTKSYYYRVLQHNQDGSETASGILFLRSSNPETRSLNLVPNPGSQSVRWDMKGDFSGDEVFQMDVTGMDGRMVYENHASLRQLEVLINRNLFLFPKGIYQVRLHNAGHSESIRMVRE